MLEQAVIDANALKKAALESAEAAIVEKYSHEIKEAVETLLEQDEEEMVDDFPGEVEGEEGGEESSEFVDQMPSAYPTGDEATGDKLDGLKDAVEAAEEALEGVGDAADELVSSSLSGDEDEEIEIDFDQLEAEMGDEGEMDAADLGDREGLADDVVELEESLLAAIAEELNVDVSASRSGWGNDGVPDAVMADELDKAVAHEQDDNVQEETENFKQAVADLTAENKQLKNDINKMREVLSQAKDRLQEVNLSNAKLVYSNKTYVSDSLNERQKNKIVDAISKATTVAEAKIIYETLQSTVGSVSTREPKSLSETISRKSSTLLPRRNEERGNSVKIRDRMQRLAGIKQ
tara:strand:+ start:979 stop:2025 length:1047 start_codon:yes stop_codon:yes gene_type:complete